MTHWRTGSTLPDSTKRLLSDQKKGELNPNHKGTYVTPAGNFKDLRSAAMGNNIAPKTVKDRCKNPYFQTSGYAFIPKNTLPAQINLSLSHYLTKKRDGVLDNGKKAAHYAIYTVQCLSRNRRWVSEKVGPNYSMREVDNKISVSFGSISPTEGHQCLQASSFLTTGATQRTGEGVTDFSVTTNLLDVTGRDTQGGVTNDAGVFIKNNPVVTEGEVPSTFGQSEISLRNTPGRHSAHPFGIFSRTAVLPTLNTDNKLIQAIHLQPVINPMIKVKTVSLLLSHPVNK